MTSQHYCSVALPTRKQHGEVVRCTCGIFYQWIDYDSEDWGWYRCDEHGCLASFDRITKWYAFPRHYAWTVANCREGIAA